ncbi:putative membrane protein [Paenarthrobacter nicotinovorans]|uniref:Membrane protein n=2 Tax=Paenarthrobacter nicotinovorans TaxID=29320 RepID=A0ABT9TKR8_PAENI|nr:YhgE/Pip domain-containing protein [Paenarthrobacter nicotinovorans]BCW09466.1 ABC transporter [Arthrobacter sp. NtRootA2]BCW13546.1 ABC transporter [Arthrobacter sp. NtRootA4]BCW21882.1 ABC transporter [Arthrobacter sp. NtRootC7]BCW26149.1 ABC transporter [Arthrobacter sp. NtRootC45]BCW30419.1 ABC transporter [Arthrobacter sp. NtRootD5]
MTVLRLARSELKRMTGGLLPKLTILALTMVPLLYGAVYLYANWDPYGNLNQIDAALVVEDTGATSKDGTELQAGKKVADSLEEGHVFNWKQVSSAEEADAGVRTGEYAFALRIPKDFSANLVSPGSFDAANQAMLHVTTNDANNYLLSTIVDKLTTAVHSTVAKEVGEETANQLLTGFGTIHASIVKAADGASELATGVGKLSDGAATLHTGTGQLVTGADQLVSGQTQLRDGAVQLNTGAGQLSSGLTELKNKTATLPADSQKLADGAAQVAAGNAELNAKVQEVVGQLDAADKGLRNRVVESNARLVTAGVLTQEQADKVLADFDAAAASSPVTDAKAKISGDAAKIQQLSDGSAAVSAGAQKLAGATPTLTDAISQAAAGAGQLNSGAATLAAGQQTALDGAVKLDDGARQLDDGAGQLASGAVTASDGSHTLATELAKGAGEIPNPNDEQKSNVSKVIADPVSVNNVSQAKAGSYGAGLAPFFLTLALWIGVFMLVQAMRPITQRALASNAPAWKIAVGGWLPFFVVSVLQATILTLVVDLGLGLNPAHPIGMWLFMLAAVMAFSAIIQGIVALMGTPGKFVVLILLVLQLVSSGGTFPWQTTPMPLHVVHEVLPMGYVVTGMRHLIYGGELSMIWPTVLGLLGYTLLGAALSTLAVRKHKMWTLKTLKPEIAV